MIGCFLRTVCKGVVNCSKSASSSFFKSDGYLGYRPIHIGRGGQTIHPAEMLRVLLRRRVGGSVNIVKKGPTLNRLQGLEELATLDVGLHFTTTKRVRRGRFESMGGTTSRKTNYNRKHIKNDDRRFRVS